jgi:hypothetical protein
LMGSGMRAMADRGAAGARGALRLCGPARGPRAAPRRRRSRISAGPTTTPRRRRRARRAARIAAAGGAMRRGAAAACDAAACSAHSTEGVSHGHGWHALGLPTCTTTTYCMTVLDLASLLVSGSTCTVRVSKIPRGESNADTAGDSNRGNFLQQGSEQGTVHHGASGGSTHR